MSEIVFLLEERSAQALLQSLLPRVLAPGIGFRLIPFEGKQDLEKQLMRRIRAYKNPQARFIVLRDQDSHPDCKAVKQRLLSLCQQSGRGSSCKVRLACRELETFYLADLDAVGVALEIPKLDSHQLRRKFRSPDGLESPGRELRLLTGHRYEKIAGSRVIGQHLRVDNVRSRSFMHLLTAIQSHQAALLQGAQ